MEKTERERLIGLFKKTRYTPFPNGGCDFNLADQFSDYALKQIVDEFLANGVIVPPCEVGTELHFLWDRTQFGFPVQILSTDDWQICTDIDGTYIDCKDIPISFKGTSRYVLGKTVFLTKEEAEQALRKEDEGK